MGDSGAAMSLVQTIDQIEYPESDGRPMGETDIHIDWMIRIRDILRYRYLGRQTGGTGCLTQTP
jgi:hypothetical protein